MVDEAQVDSRRGADSEGKSEEGCFEHVEEVTESVVRKESWM